jgi:predicted phage tail protein
MQIKFLGDLESFQDTELHIDNLRQLLAGLKHLYGQDLADKLISGQYRYVLVDSCNPDNSIAIHPELATMNFAQYDTLLIVPDVAGEVPAAAVAAVIGVSATSFTAIAVTAVINIALSFALNMIVNLLSPTPEFDKDPAAAQKLDSALFNGAPQIREQGGSVPLAYGRPHCGGVLISSGLSTEEKTV